MDRICRCCSGATRSAGQFAVPMLQVLVDMSRESDWLPLVVDQGQPAYSIGRMIEFGGSPFLQVDGALGMPPDGSMHSASMLVALRSVGSPEAFARYDGLRVVATGRWDDEWLAVDDLAEAAAAPATDRRAPSSGERGPSGAAIAGDSFALRAVVERELIEEGVLIDTWVTGDGWRPLRRVALAVDVDRVREALGSSDYVPLEVVRSRWSAEELGRIESEICAEESLLRSFGRSVGLDMQMRVAVTVLRMTSRLRHRLDQLPSAAIDLECLVLPGRPIVP